MPTSNINFTSLGIGGGMAGSDWLSYTPTWTSTGTAPTLGNGTITGQYRRVGDSIDVIIKFVSGSTSTAGTGKWQFTIPSGLTINESKLNTTNNRPIGFGIMQNFAGSDHVFISPTYITSDSNKVRANVYYISSSRLSVFDQIGPTEPGSFVAGQCNITLSFSVPITGFTAGGSGSTGPRSMVRLNTGNGSGATNTTVQRFLNTNTNTGSAITYTDSATLGATFTINEAGVYAISFSLNQNTAAAMGLSLNAATPSNALSSLSVNERLAYSTSDGDGNPGHVAWTGILAANDVIRAHHQGNTDGSNAARTSFTITKVTN
jgi:hypothetical protein